MYNKERMREILEKYGYVSKNVATPISPEWYTFAAQLMILERLDNLQTTNEFIFEKLSEE